MSTLICILIVSISMIKPYYTYILIFTAAVSIYKLQWSELYPDLSLELILFLLTTFLVCFFIAKQVYKPIVKNFYPINPSHRTFSISYLVLMGWTIEFIYNRGIPILLIMQGVDYDYASFGIPSFHPFLATFSSFWVVHNFHLYLSSKSRKILIFFLLNNIPHLLLFSRGAVLINIVSCLFLYIADTAGKLDISKISIAFAKIFALVLVIFYIFGSLGNIRTEHAYDQVGKENIILDMGKATQSFRESPIPAEFLWGYLYISSPLANLQTTINITKSDQYMDGTSAFFEFVNNEILPDFISKRLNKMYSHESRQSVLIDPQFNVSTVYARSYTYLSWVGMFLMASLVCLFPLLYTSLLHKENPFNLTAISILKFDNMFVFSGLILQLIYPLIFQFTMQSRQTRVGSK
jgi:hypothetical protein